MPTTLKETPGRVWAKFTDEPDVIAIICKDKTPADYCIINMVGEIVMNDVLKNGNSKISIRHLPAGLYMIQVKGEHPKTVKLKKN